MVSRSVFLDRDGTINREVHHLNDVQQLELLTGAAAGIRLLNRSGYKVVIVTNQAAIARGLLSEEGLQHIHERLQQMLLEENAHVDAIYHCPHHPAEGVGAWRIDCDCRKPKPGSILRAAEDMAIDLGHSWMVGDKVSDLQAGFAVGCGGVLVRTGYGQKAESDYRRLERQPNYIAENLLEAARWIVRQST